MIKKIVANLKFSIALFELPKRELIFWILIRAFTAAISPLMMPAIIWVMLNAIEQMNVEIITSRALLLLVILVPCFGLSYFIYVFSDAWVLKSMYKYQQVCLKKTMVLNLQERRENYKDGDISNILNQSAWSLIQIWLHIFRIMAPFASIVVLVVLEIKIHFLIFVISIISVLCDYMLLKYQSKKNYEYKNDIMKVEGKREQCLKEMIYGVTFYATQGIWENKLDELLEIREDYWRINQKKEYNNFFSDIINMMFNGVFNIGIWNILGVNSLILGAGEIATANNMFDNLRLEVGSFRKQMVGIVDKYTPIEKQRDILNLGKNLTNVNKESELLCEGKSVSVVLEGRKIIDNISFNIKEGDKIAIIGENGAGKSTLLKCICGLLKDENSSINYQEKRENIMDYVPADRLIFSQSVYENVCMGLKNEEEPFAEECIQQAELYDNFSKEEVHNKSAMEISGGEAQRMSIARGLAGKRKIILMDEPTASLDHATAAKIMNTITASRATIIFTTHNPVEIDFATRIWMVSNGHLIGNFSVKEFKESKLYLKWSGLDEKKAEED